MTPEHEMAADLLDAIWRGIPADYKSKYRRTIWQQFEDQVRSAAYTSRLPRFVNSLCQKLEALPGKGADERVRIDAVLNAGSDRELLKLLRDETTVLVLMVRLRNQERQEAYRERMAEREAEFDEPLFAED